MEYREGYEAFRDGLGVEANPYFEDGNVYDRRYYDWRAGWYRAQSDCMY